MSDQPYKITSKIGLSEFTGEGPENSVREDYARWLAAVAALPSQVSQALPPHLLPASTEVYAPTVRVAGATAHLSTLPREQADRAFREDGDWLTLRHLPPTTNKIADAAVVLLFGYQILKGLQEVPVIKLNESLRRSGLNVSRLDRELGVNQALIRKGGQKSGGRFSLNNQGVQQAEKWIAEWS